MKRLLPLIKIAVSIISVGLSFASHIYLAELLADQPDYPSKEFQKGICYVSWEPDTYASSYSDRSIESLTQIGTNWISILTTWYQKDANSPRVYPTEKTPQDTSLKHAIRKAHELGLKVMLKPHVDLVDTDNGQWRGEIFFYNNEDWKRWFGEYKIFITHYAALAQASGVDMLCIGTELSGTIDRRDDWIEVIRAIRQIYKGRLTYAANWSDEFERIGFWDKLDYAGVDAYFPLAKDENPTLAELKNAWKGWVDQIEIWAKFLGKPIIFTEVGYPSVSTAAIAPWQWNAPGGPKLQIQERCYRALLETIWGRQWLAGIYCWNWSANPDAGGPYDESFTLQNKPAQKILAEWYQRS